MSDTILIRGARQLLTLHGPPGPRRGTGMLNLAIIEDGSVLVIDGKIAAVGPTRRVENLADARDARELDATGRVVMPAFVDAHTELMRDCGHTNLRKLDASAHRVLDGCVRHGTTTVEARSGCGRDDSADLRMLRSAMSLGGDSATVVPVYAAPENESVLQRFDEALFPRIQSRGLARYAAARCGADGFDTEQLGTYMRMCARFGLSVKVEIGDAHASQCIRSAVENGAAVVEGLAEVDEEALAALNTSSVMATIVPALAGTRRQQGSTARRLIESGVPVALGSGFRHDETSTFSMQMTIALACANLDLHVEEAISASTINSAYGVGLGEATGSLQFGKDADMIVLNISDYQDIGQYFGVNLVAVTMKRGRVVYRESPLL